MGKSGRTERTVMISVEEPRPLLNEGKYRARCTAATIAWSRRWKKWIVKLHMEPLDWGLIQSGRGQGKEAVSGRYGLR